MDKSNFPNKQKVTLFEVHILWLAGQLDLGHLLHLSKLNFNFIYFNYEKISNQRLIHFKSVLTQNVIAEMQAIAEILL